jgi:hypothetical protein
MASEEQKQFNREVIARQREMANKREWICCGNCYYMPMRDANAPEHCTLYDCLPPLAVLIGGCESWTEGSPF